MKNQLFMFILLLLSPVLLAQETVILTESSLSGYISESPPTVQEIEASFLISKQAKLSIEDGVSYELEGSGQIYESKESLLSNFDGGVTKSSTSYSLGVNKPTLYGINIGAKLFSSKMSNAFITDASTTGASLSLSMDLFKNFLGRQSKNSQEKSSLAHERAKFEKQIGIKNFESNLRKLYWALVANNERKRLLTSIVELSKKQYQQAVRRKKSRVADSGEVARYRSQWTTRTAILLALTYQKNEILKQLKHLIPDLNGKNVEIGPYNVEKTIIKVLACSAQINTYAKAPFEFTPYDEMIDYLQKEETIEKKIINTYDDPSISLTGEYSSVGRDFGFENSLSDFTDNGKARTSIGLQFSIPLGSSKKRTKDIQQEILKRRNLALTSGNLAKIKAFHSETSSMITILQQVVRNQKETNKFLTISLAVNRKKFAQARISVQELISEQDAQLQSKLNEIDTNLIIMNTLLEYFSIYTDFPCDLNRI